MVLFLHLGGRETHPSSLFFRSKEHNRWLVVVAGDQLVWEQHSVPLRNSQLCVHSREADFMEPRLEDFVGSVKCVQWWPVQLKL